MDEKLSFKYHLLTFTALIFTVSIYSFLMIPETFLPPNLTQISQFEKLNSKMISKETSFQKPKIVAGPEPAPALAESEDDVIWGPRKLKGKCDPVLCRALAGNCDPEEGCVSDSGWALKTDQFNVPRPLSKYSWENDNITSRALEKLPANSIPFIFHRTWKNTKIPKDYNPFLKDCLDTHPTWKNVLWTDKDNYELVRREFPQYLYIYQRFQRNIERADFIRYLYMYHYGGLYVDLDVDCLKNSEELIKDKIIVLGAMGEDFPHNVPNAIMYSRKKHPFWLFVVNLITTKMHHNMGVESTTGPVILKDAYELFRKIEGIGDDIYVTKPGLLYGVDWRKRPTDYPECGSRSPTSLEVDNCRAHFPDVYLITYWYHSWEDKFTVSHPE
eukprot:NODE_609_length_5433_cov_1.015186.p2 type:complete len:386 gc:universal NODE_609_length_5433_cov_1.015186:126-1283(+)